MREMSRVCEKLPALPGVRPATRVAMTDIDHEIDPSFRAGADGEHGRPLNDRAETKQRAGSVTEAGEGDYAWIDL